MVVVWGGKSVASGRRHGTDANNDAGGRWRQQQQQQQQQQKRRCRPFKRTPVLFVFPIPMTLDGLESMHVCIQFDSVNVVLELRKYSIWNEPLRSAY